MCQAAFEENNGYQPTQQDLEDERLQKEKDAKRRADFDEKFPKTLKQDLEWFNKEQEWLKEKVVPTLKLYCPYTYARLHTMGKRNLLSIRVQLHTQHPNTYAHYCNRQRGIRRGTTGRLKQTPICLSTCTRTLRQAAKQLPLGPRMGSTTGYLPMKRT